MNATPPDRPAWQMPPWLPQAADERWAYLLDDHGIIYGPGPWPFYTDDSASQFPNAQFPVSRMRPAMCAVRLAPDIAFYAWHTEYVLLCPTATDGVAGGSCYLQTGSPERGQRVSFRLRHLDGRWQTDPRTNPPVDDDEVGRLILVEKTRRAAQFLDQAVAERDAGASRPTTAADIEDRRAAHPGGVW